MTISNPTEEYSYDAKTEWRTYVLNEMLSLSLNIKDGKLKNKWLEPVGRNAITFNELLSKEVIDENQLIGIDYNTDSPNDSLENIVNCSRLFPEATFYNKLWSNFCYEYDKNDIEYIVYDLYTSTHGREFISNMQATFDLINKCLRNIDQVILVINADIGITRRHNKTLKEYEYLLLDLINKAKLSISDVNTENIYTYQNTITSTTMGTIILEF